MIDETVEEIREMESHSSSLVAVKAARALETLTDREFRSVEEYTRDLERNSSALRQANPSHAVLQRTQRDLVEAVTEEGYGSLDAVKAATHRAVSRVIEAVERGKRGAARNGADVIRDGMTLLTHDHSSTVMEAIELATRDGAHIEVYVTEARPRYFGRKTARRLAENDRIETHLAIDGACGEILPDCDRVLVGMDCLVEDTLYNRVGTFPIAATANEVGTPVTAIGSGLKLITEGFVFENADRPAIEVLREPAEGFSIDNPAYDATPTRLLDNVVTDNGTDVSLSAETTIEN